MVYALRVNKFEAEKIRKKLLKKDLIDPRWSIIKEGDFIVFPLKEKIEGAIEINLPPRTQKKSPYQLIKEKLDNKILPPKHWEKLGDIVLLPPFEGYEQYRSLIGKTFAEVLKAKTVAIYKGTKGEYREPIIEKIYGENTETIHIENGIKYKLDVSKVMFSSGNVDERIRMSKINASNEIIVDLFAGIGYFTLPLAIYGKPKKIYACEKNPVAMKYLIENIHLNNIKNIVPLLGDNRKTAPLKIANRVVMGYIDTEKFLPLGFNVLSPSGGIIHYHNTFTTEEISWKPEKSIHKYASRYGYKIKILYKHIVKSYAPHIWHVVVDVQALPKN